MSAGGAGSVSAHPSTQASAVHVPVLFAQVMEGLAVKTEGTYLDGTFGRSGHARGVLQGLRYPALVRAAFPRAQLTPASRPQ